MSRWRFLLLASLAAMAVSLAVLWVLALFFGTSLVPPKAPAPRSRAELAAAAKLHVDQAERDADLVIDKQAARFGEFIELRKQGVKPFTEELLSWKGKWRAVKPLLPLTDPAGHTKYVDEVFSKHIFSEAVLAQKVSDISATTANELAGIENLLAEKLKKEILGRDIRPEERKIATEAFQTAINNAVSASQRDVANTAANFAASEVAAQVTVQAVRAMAISTGALASATVSASVTMGAGIVVGLLVSEIWDMFTDPHAKIEKETAEALNRLAADVTAKLRSKLSAMVKERGESWNKQSLEMMQ